MSRIVFIDVKTYRKSIWENLPDWEKSRYLQTGFDRETYNREAGLSPVTGKVICITLGYQGKSDWRCTSLYGSDEIDILTKFSALSEPIKSSGYSLGGYGITKFDKPFLINRFIANGLKVPELLKDYKNKIWEQSDIDLAVGYRYGNGPSLSLVDLGIMTGRIESSPITYSDYWLLDEDKLDWEKLTESSRFKVELEYKIYNYISNCI